MSEQEKKPMTREQRRKFIERYLLYPTVALIGVIIVYLIFASPSNEEPKTQSEFNVTVPEAVEEELAESKKSAYAKEQTKQADEDRGAMITLAQKMIGEKREKTPEVTPKEKVAASTEAYRNMNRTVGTFYTTPKVDTEKERMQKELDELKEQLAKGEQSQPSMGVEEQIALMEKSYELAAKYSPNGQGAQQQPTTTPQIENAKKSTSGKDAANAVGQVREVVVSALAQEMSNAEFMDQYSQPRNYGFNTAIGGDEISKRNTISAVIHSDQTITDGGAVKLRLTEPMMVGDKLLPRNSFVTGEGKVQGERLNISVSHMVYQGTLIPVELTVVDSDGQSGIFIPNSMEINAVKEVAASLGSTMGTTINLNQQSAGDQILTEVGKGAIQGASQYVSKKMQEVRVHLKAGYQIMLYQKR
ncbi:MAG: conjugative transposon protein TraM [Rikenellaceae bacterium]